MTTNDISFSEAVAGWEALMTRMAFEQEVSSTPVGKQSFKLREQARPLRENGDWQAAFALHTQAANLFSKDDPSPAAAMAWFDLARCYEHSPRGVRKDNLRNAERLYRRVLVSPALPKDPHRMAMVRDALASCLRYLAYEENHPELIKRLLDEAVKLFERAVEIALKTGSAGFEDVVSFSHNLANCHAQRGNYTAALFAMDRAEAYIRRAPQFIPSEKRLEYMSRILFHSASHRAQRGAQGDLAHAKNQLLEAIDIGHPDWVDMVEMRVTALLLQETPPALEQAQAMLRRVRVERIPKRALVELAQHYADAGMRKEALVLYQGMIQRAMKHWRHAMADHLADHHVAEAQAAAHKAARLHLEEEDALEAFFTLEDVSGLRFAENVDAFTHIHGDPVLRVLASYHHGKSSTAVMLEDFSSRLVHGMVDIPTLLQHIKKFEIPAEDSYSRDELNALIQILEEASRHPDTMGFLAQKAREVGEDAIRLRDRIRQMDPSIVPERNKPWLYRLSRDVVRDLLLEYPGHALVRLSLAEDLLVIVVWLEGDELKARHHRVNVPKELFPRIARQRQNSKDAPLKLLQKIAKDLESIDLSPAFPPHRMAHAVLLPSYAASLLPLGALGPRGKMLLDHFDALSWTPSVAPLFIRQGPTAPRHGVVSVAPGETLHHSFAFGLRLPSETRIEGPEATEERILAAARTADVVCLYTHGQHAGERGPHVCLHGEEYLDEPSPVAGWAGMERIELWACQSGVNLPTDPLVPHVDEAFGLDVQFVRNGVRSAIGTLWSVPDFVTACIVRTYRRGLRNGLPAPHALAEAQRFWRDEGIKSLLDHLTKATTVEAGLRAFKATLGGELGEETHDADLLTFLGPAATPREDPQRRMLEQLQRLAHPLAWAGFRFVGVHERRPTEPYDPEKFRPLAPEEIAEGKRIVEETLRKPAIEPKGKPLDEWFEEWLTEAAKLSPDASPAPEQAIRVARLYRDRLVSAHRHNLLAALAWLHEAMAATSRTSQDWQQLAIEAAWLWFEFARGDAIVPQQFMLNGPHRIALVRAERLLNGLPEDVHVWMLRSCIEMWRASEVHKSDIAEVIERVWSVTKSVILSIRRPDSYEAMRTLAAAWEMPMFFPKLIDEAADLAAERIDDILDLPNSDKQVIGVLSRLQNSMALVVMKRRPDIINELEGRDALTPRERAREALRLGMVSNEAKTFELPMQNKRFNQAWDAIEGALWGWPDDDRTPIWASTGTLDGAYRRLVASLFVGIARAPGDVQDAIQFLACLQPLCDLRLPLIRRWVYMMQPWTERHLLFFWIMAREREMVLAYLEDAALMCDLEAASKDRLELQPHPLDPFRYAADEVETKCASVLDIMPWQIAHACGWFPKKDLPNARTTAFHAIWSIEERTRALVSMWQGFLEASEKVMEGRDERLPPISEIFDPGIRLPNRRDLLRGAPPGAAVLGLGVEAAGHLVAALLWNTGNGFYEQVCLTDAKDGGRLQDLLAKLHIDPIAAEPRTRALAAGRTTAWNEVQSLLEPVLEKLLGPALEKGLRQLAILAPGSLRSLPILGLKVGGAPLYERVGAIHHLPSLEVDIHATDKARGEACWLPAERERGDTSLGEAAIQTLRRWFAPVVIRPPAALGREVAEVEQLEPLGLSLRTLRIYAASHPAATTPSTAGFALEGGRVFSNKNTRGLMLPKCQVVELWAATAGHGPVDTIRRDDRDQIPGLAGEFLACGASAVLDLAWPIFDLVKALVCERYGIARRLPTLDSCAALLEAISSTATLLRKFRNAAPSFVDVKMALVFLDEDRRATASAAALDARAIVPFTDHLDAPSLKGLSVEALVEEACNPVHLAAFRYWMWL